jgi:hypothetical protein
MGEEDTVLMRIDRKRELHGSTESGGDFDIVIGGLESTGVGSSERDSRVVGCTGA